MPQKGFYSQGVAILLSRTITLEELEPLLAPLHIAKRNPESSNPHFSGPSLLIPYRPEVNGYLAIDLRDSKWPDDMGDPKTNADLFGAWAMGHYGPFTFPGSLARSVQHLWAWPEGKIIPEKHAAFLRLRISYILGAVEKESKVLPPEYDSLDELNFLNKVVAKILDHPAALLYFNPNGEVLRNKQKFLESLSYHESHNLPSLSLWSNVRLFKLPMNWTVMDTVGIAQLDRMDSEACFPAGSFEPSEVDGFLRNCALYLIQNGDVIEDKNTMDGPGAIRWWARHVEKPVYDPPRRFLRWFPLDDSNIPPELLPTKNTTGILHKVSSWFRKK